MFAIGQKLKNQDSHPSDGFTCLIKPIDEYKAIRQEPFAKKIVLA